MRTYRIFAVICGILAGSNGALGVPVIAGLSPAREARASPGQSVALAVSAISSGSIRYQWKHNGKPIEGAAESNLAIAKAADDDAGWYTVTVSDDAGAIDSAPIFVVVAPTNSRPIVWRDPLSSLGYEGQDALPAGLTNAIAFATSVYHTVALRCDGTVTTWTSDYYSLYSISTPSGLSGVVKVAAGLRYTLVLKNDSTMVEWPSRNAPANISGVVAIDSGLYHSLALKNDGTVIAWGGNTDGETNVPAGLGNVVAIAAGDYHSMALKDDGTVVTWGSNFAGQLNVPAGLNNVTAVAAGNGHSLALKSDGTVVAWGDNYYGQCSVPAGLNGVKRIAAGSYHSLALKSDGSVVQWGAGKSAVPTSLAPAFAISAGQQFSFALSDATADTVPVVVTQPASQGHSETETAVFSVSVTGPAPITYVWRKNGTPITGATAATLRLPNLTLADAGDYDVVVTDYLGATISAVAHLTVEAAPVVTTTRPVRQVLGLGQTLELGVSATGAGTLRYQWLRNGQPINGATGSTYVRNSASMQDDGAYEVVVYDDHGSRHGPLSFVIVAPAITQIVGWKTDLFVTNIPATITDGVAVAAGNGRAVVLRADGTLGWWGYGVGTSVPVWSDVVAVGAGANGGIIALKSDATVVAWGAVYGEDWVPAGLSDVIAVAEGSGYALALRRDGTVVTWGGLAIAPPADLANVTAIAAGDNHALALKSDGTVVAWGSSSSQQTSVPPGLDHVAAIAAGRDYSMALKSDGSVVAWGDNSYGQTDVPANLTGVVAISSRSTHSLALKSDGKVVAWGDDSSGQTEVPAGISGVFAIGAGARYSIALRDATADGVVISSSPADVTSSETQAAMFEVSATGGSTLSYQWRKNGVSIPGATAAVLKLSSLTQADAGSYDVVVSNYIGAVTSAAGRLTVNPSPTIDTLSTTRHVLASGQELSLSVSAHGTGALSYQWTHNGRPIPGVTSSNLDRIVLNPFDGGYYQVNITDSLGTRRSAPIFVIVTSWSSVTKLTLLQPASTGMFWGPLPSNLTDVVSLDARGTFALGVRSGGQVTGWGSSAVGEIYPPDVVTDVVAASACGNFSVVLNRDGTVYEWGQSPPAVPAGLSDVVAISSGGNYVLALRSDGTVVGWGDNSSGQCDIPAGLKDVVAVAAAGYFPVALKSDGTVVTWGHNDAYVSSYVPSTMPQNLSDVIAIAGGSLNTIALRRDGTVVSWGVDYSGINAVPSNLGNVAAIAMGVDCAAALRNDGTLVVWGRNSAHITAPSDLTNVVAFSLGSSASTALQATPAILSSPEAQTLTVGSAASFSVTVFGGGPFTYQWRKNGVPIAGATASSFGLDYVTPADAGVYDVVVTNAIGSSASASATLAVPFSSIVNISSRAYGSTGNNVAIGGFVVAGSAAKRYLIHAVGPTLATQGIAASEVMQDPAITVHATLQENAVIAANDNWGDNTDPSTITNVGAQLGATAFAGYDRTSSALLLTLQPGVYTFVVEGKSGTAGVVLAEVYDADPGDVRAKLVNISSRARATTGDGVAIGGFVVSGNMPKRLLVRAVGPSLSTQHLDVSEILRDPVIEVHDMVHGNAVIATNDNWGDNANAADIQTVGARIGAMPLNADDMTSSALLLTLQPGVYSFVASGKGDSSGIVLVEVYDAD